MIYKTEPLIRFENLFIKASDASCWEWRGCRNKQGYGKFAAVRQRPSLAHRFSYEAYKGKIEDGKIVRHTCDNPSCVNPAHLIIGTHKDNSRDMVERQRDLAAIEIRREKTKAFWAKVTHCQRGHPFDERNTFIRKGGQRTCRACRNAAQNSKNRIKRMNGESE